MENFCFKEFKVRQSHSAMKVNTDGVLLGAWLSLPCLSPGSLSVEKYKVLDIGTGTGVISLIIAQRLSKLKSAYIFCIDAIDIDKSSVEEANYNFSNSPWADYLIAREISLQNLLTEQNPTSNSEVKKYNRIVSNPPYFIDSLKTPCKRRTSARHNDDLPYEVIIDAAVTMLEDGGALAIVLPREEGEKFIAQTTGTPLHLARRCKVKTLAGKREKRYLMEFMKARQYRNETTKTNLAKISIAEEVLVIQETGGLKYTEQYKNLTKELYLNF
ncbi:MAG: methyltransferase [Bacteroidales bacterium]